jgi:hypothetical protein
MYIYDICEISFVCLDGIGKTNKKVCTGHFVECNTWQSTSLPSVRTIALDKEPRSGYQYKFFAEYNASGTRQRSTLCRVSYCKCPRKSTRQRRLCRCTMCRALFVECDTQQSLCRVFLSLCRVLQALGKAVGSGSGCYGWIRILIRMLNFLFPFFDCEQITYVICYIKLYYCF